MVTLPIRNKLLMPFNATIQNVGMKNTDFLSHLVSGAGFA